MKSVIKPGTEFKDIIKYIIINRKNKQCHLIPVRSRMDLAEIQLLLEESFTDLKLICHDPLNLNQEIRFIWPQLVNDFNNRFSFVREWLKNANIAINDNCLMIEVESNLAFKKIKNDRILSFMENRLAYYLEKRIEIEVANGDFLADIEPEEDPLLKKSVEIKRTKIVYGNNILTATTHSIKEVQSEEKQVITCGQIFDIRQHQTRNGKLLYIISITDKSDSVTVKFFLDKNRDLKTGLKKGDWIKVKGQAMYDRYSSEVIIMASDVVKTEVKQRKDKAVEKRVELHLHTQMSAMDSVVEVDQVIKKAAEWGQPGIAITDHGVVQAFPDAARAGEEYGIKIIYGVEAYLVDDGEPIIFNEIEQSIAESTFVVFDLETTGLNPSSNEIIEIGAVKLKDGKVISEFSTLVKPENEIPNKIIQITGIDNEMVKDAPSINEIISDFKEFIEGAVLVAHNAGFDYGFIRPYLETEDYPVLDTLALSRAVLPDEKNHKLDTLTESLGIKLDRHHRAIDDARATAELFIKLIKDVDNLDQINELKKDADWRNLYPYHVVILARNQEGLKSLYKLVSSSHLDYFYRRPRILKSKLMACRENLLIGSACEAGQLFRSIIQNKSQREIEETAKFYDFIELMPLGNNQFLIPEKVQSKEKLQDINLKLYKLGKKFNKRVVATGDVHFIEPEDKIYREILQAGQGYDDYSNQAPLYFRTTGEMLSEFDYLGEEIAREIVIENPVNILEEIEEIKPIPDGLFTPKIDGADEQIREMSYENAQKMYGNPLPDFIESRLEKELNAIISNGYAVIYLIAHKLVKKSIEDGYLVGSRGSVGSSLVATMCGITEVNPLSPHYRCPDCLQVEFIDDSKYSIGIDLPDKECPECGHKYIKDGFDIPFEVFMGFMGDKVPDIDLNFSGEYQNNIHQETEELFGRDFVFRAGTISTIAGRTAFGFVKGYMEDNGLVLRQAEIKRLVDGCSGTRRTTGQHPGGLMVVPRNLDIHDFSPIQYPANDQESEVRTTHFDYHSISGRILKLDLLGHDDPTSLRMLEDLTGINPDDIPLDDPATMSIFSSTDALNVSPEEIGAEVGTLGIPEFGTSFVRQMLEETKPTTFAELVRISGLSHGTDVWLNNARDLIKDGKAVLSEVISVRDDIMNYLIQKGLEPQTAFWIMEHVRKGKGLTKEEEKYMQESGVPLWYIESCKKIKYMFPKAHAAAYVMMAFRIAFFKVHYPREFYVTYFSNNAANFDALLIGRGFEYIQQVKQELEKKGNNATAKEKGTLTVLEIAIEAILRGVKFAEVDLYKSDAHNFTPDDKGLVPPFISLQGLGDSAARKIAVTRKERAYTSIEDFVNRTGISKNVIEVMKEHGSLDNLPERDQLSLF